MELVVLDGEAVRDSPGTTHSADGRHVDVAEGVGTHGLAIAEELGVGIDAAACSLGDVGDTGTAAVLSEEERSRCAA